jgi:hypothetical protein
MGPFKVFLQFVNALKPTFILGVPDAVHVIVSLLFVVVVVTEGTEQRGLPLPRFGREVIRDGNGREQDGFLLTLLFRDRVRGGGLSSRVSVLMAHSVFELDVRVLR